MIMSKSSIIDDQVENREFKPSFILRIEESSLRKEQLDEFKKEWNRCMSEATNYVITPNNEVTTISEIK
jgi:hypothetical protein